MVDLDYYIAWLTFYQKIAFFVDGVLRYGREGVLPNLEELFARNADNF